MPAAGKGFVQRVSTETDLAGEVDRRAPERQRLRDLLVRRSQQRALREELGVGVVSLCKRLGQRLRLGRTRGQSENKAGERPDTD